MFDIDRGNCSNVTQILKFILVMMFLILGPFFCSTTAIADTTQTGSISGQVVDESGNPISNATVIAYLVDDEIVIGIGNICSTNALGNYIITSLESGEYRIVVKSSSWASQEYSTHVIVKAPNDTSQINFTLHPGGSISGTILDEQGTPITNARVCARLVNSNLFLDFYSVDAKGNYTINGLDSGAYKVEVEADGWIKQQRTETVTVTAPNNTENINFTLQKGGSVSGKVIDEQGQPIKNAHVYISIQANLFYYYCNSNTYGEYIIQSLPSGSYEVNITANGWIGQKYNQSVEVVAPNDTGNINFTLQRGGSISGRVLDDQGQPIVEANVYITSIPLSSDPGISITDNNGDYVIKNLPSGTYYVNVQATGWISQKYIQSVEVVAPNDTGNINFTMQRGGIISGRVLNEQGNPIIKANVNITLIKPPYKTYYGIADDNGNYIIQSLPSGTFNVAVQATGWIRQTYSDRVEVVSANLKCPKADGIA